MSPKNGKNKGRAVTSEQIRQIMVNQGVNFPKDQPWRKWVVKKLPWLAPYLRPAVDWYVMDQYFFLCDEAEMWDIIKSDQSNERVYEPEIGDCDNYSFELRSNPRLLRRGLACGILIISVREGLHAIFFFINDKGVFIPVEPQDDSVFTRPYIVRGVIMY